MSDDIYRTPDGRIGITVRPKTELDGLIEAAQVGSPKAASILDKLLGLNGVERFQTWPERLIRSGASLAGDMMKGDAAYVPGLRRADVTDIPAPSDPTADSTWLGRQLGLAPVSAEPNDTVIERAQDMSGLMLGGGLATGPKEAAALSSAGHRVTKQPPVFYSGVERAIEAAPQAKMTPEQWSGYLRNQPGVKAEELQWLSLDDHAAWPGELGGNKLVTKDQLLEHAGGHGVKIKEVEKKRNPLNEDNVGEHADSILQQWRGQDPEAFAAKFKIEPRDDGMVNIVDQFGNILEVTNADVAKSRLDKARNDFKGAMLNDDVLMDWSMEAAQNGLRHYGSGAPKFSDYQLPGGDNYRELLLTMPEQSPKFFASHWDEPNVLVHMRMNDRILPTEFTPEQRAVIKQHKDAEPKVQELRAKADAIIKQIGDMARPLHTARDDTIIADLSAGKINNAEARKLLESPRDFEELKPLKEQLAQVRAEQDALRASLPPKPEQPSLKSLHLEEVQSDWHQQGRKQGYKDPKITIQAVIDAEKIANVAWQKATHQYARDMGWDVPSASNMLASSMSVPGTPAFAKLTPETQTLVTDWNGKWKAYLDASEALNKQGSYVPDAPFKQSWPDLALKRAISKAAREGYDAISWTPGEQQAERYDLSKHVDKLEYNPETGHLLGRKGDRVPIDKSDVAPDKLADYVGKDAAEKLLSQNKGGKDKPKFKVSGSPEEGFIIEGAEDFPVTHGASGVFQTRADAEAEAGILNSTERTYNNYAKIAGLDLKVGGEGMKAFYDKMLVDKANAIAKKFGGKVEWKSLPNTNKSGNMADPVLRTRDDAALGSYVQQIMRESNFKFMVDSGDGNTFFRTRKEAEQYLAKLKDGIKVPVLRITPAMRDAANNKGFSLFARGLPYTFTPVDHDPFDEGNYENR